MPNVDDPVTPCLDDETVDAFVAGRLGDDGADRVRRHLEACDDCRRLVAALVRSADDTEPRPNARPEGAGAASLLDDASSRAAASPLPSPNAGALTAGAVLADRYRLERRLGEGGTGIVWAATPVRAGRAVALKILKLPGPDASARFFREARILANLRHPHIVEVSDVIQLPSGAPVMVMDLLEGEPLGRYLGRIGRLSLGETVRVLLPVVSAVGAAHAAGVVHRDLKPENVFLVYGPAGLADVKVLDFGLAKLFASEGGVARTRSLTQTGSLLGTPYYMAPEQVWGARDVDHRVDVWALGAVLWECLVGERPIQGKTFGQLFKTITTQKVPRLDARVPGLPPALADLVARMTAIDREVRPANLREVFAVLSSLPRA